MPELKDSINSNDKTGNENLELKGREIADRSISAHDYPSLGLEDEEYVVIDVERSRIGLIFIWGVVITVSLIMIIFCQIMSELLVRIETTFLMVLLGYLMVSVSIILGSIESNIFRNNYMIVTNKRAFTKTQIGPFASKTQVIDLDNIEDVGVFRGGVLPTIFRYGEVRLSTELDESAYKLTFVKHPEEQVVEIRKIIYSATGNNKHDESH